MNIPCTSLCRDSFNQLESRITSETPGWNESQRGTTAIDLDKYTRSGCPKHVLLILLSLAEYRQDFFVGFVGNRMSRLNNPLVDRIIESARHGTLIVEDLRSVEGQLNRLNGALLVMLLDIIRFGRIKKEKYIRAYRLETNE